MEGFVMSQSLFCFSRRACAVALLFAVAALLVSAQGAAPWAMGGHDAQHSGRSAYNGPGGAPLEQWTFTAGDDLQSAPAIGADGTLYVTSADMKLYALNPDGTRRWVFATKGWMHFTPAIGADGTIYVHADKLYALNANGKQRWAFDTGGGLSGPTIGTDGTIYVASYSQQFYAINPDGTKKWAYHFRGGGCPAADQSPVIGADGAVYFSAYDEGLYALNTDGTLRWTFTDDKQLISAPTIGADGTLYVGSWDAKCCAINADGTLRWAFDTPWAVRTLALGADGTIYVASNTTLYALDAEGAQRWMIKTSGYIYGQPVVGADGSLYCVANNSVIASNPAGTVRWVFATGGPPLRGLALGANGTLYAGADGGILHAIVTAAFYVSPNIVTLAPGATQQFSVTPPGRVIWKATGGVISDTGLFTAGDETGVCTVTAARGKDIATATVSLTVPTP
jgi:outer membrane protein assembly factor BamB